MKGRIKREDIEEVRTRANLAEIVGQYVTLKTAGVGSLKGLCPFHDERSPSFHVRSQVGFYHCFGCGEGGDVFTFLQKMEHYTFAESVEAVAQRIGYQLSYEEGDQDGRSREAGRARLLAANADAAAFFRAQLAGAEAQVARETLVNRGFDQAASEHFGLGYSPKGWDGLHRHLRGKGYTDEELLGAGLLSSGGRGVYDRFRGRLMWPIIDLTGAVVGFGARKLYDDDPGPKYLNTPETPVYHKARVLYGLNLAKRDIARARQVVVVEGYTDVMACHLAGITTAVATCGTAFGSDHVSLIRRILGDDQSSPAEVIFTFDPDAAGQKAALRAFAEERRFVAQTYVAVPPEGLDPSDLRLERGDQAVRDMLARKQPMFDFVVRQVVGRFDLNTVEGRVNALRAAAPLVADIRDVALRPAYTRQLAGMLGMEVADVAAAVKAPARGGQGPDRARAEEAELHEEPPAAAPMRLPRDPRGRLEAQVLSVILQHPELLPAGYLDRALGVQFRDQTMAALQAAILATDGFAARADRAELVLESLPEAYWPLVRTLAVADLPVSGPAQVGPYVTGVVASLLRMELTELKADLLRRLGRLGPQDGPEESRALQRQLQQVELERRDLDPGR